MLTDKEAAQRLNAWDNILILTHIRPDGDTVGCAAALCAGLRALGKTAYLLPNDGLTENTRPYFAPYALPDGTPFTPEKIVSVDIATENLFPKNAEGCKGRVDLAVDHHPSFEAFAKENIVNPQAAACGELVYNILLSLSLITGQKLITAETALPLYVAISTDCGCFSYNNTTAYTHILAAALMSEGIDFKSVNKTFFRTKTRLRMQLEAAMLRDASFYDGDRVAVLAVPRSLMESLHAAEDDAEDLSALGPQIQGVDCAITMRELEPDEWKISLRTGPRVNASAVCAVYGGGGHGAAAGCTIKAPFQEARRKILDAVAKITGEQITGETITGEQTVG